MSIILRGESYPHYVVPVQTYPDGMPLIKLNRHEADVRVMLLRPESMTEFVAAMMLADSLKEFCPNMVLSLPHVPCSRQDRYNEEGDCLFSLKYIANMINQANFSRVYVFDPHSNVTPALVNNCHVVDYKAFIHKAKQYFPKYAAVIPPDAGAYKRASLAAEVLGTGLIQASKIRDIATGKLSGFQVQVESGKHYLVVDDICDGGGTFIGLGEKIWEQGATSDLLVSHGLFTKGVEELQKFYTRIFTTNSVPSGMGQPNVHYIEYFTTNLFPLTIRA